MCDSSPHLGALAQLTEPLLLLDQDYSVLDLNKTACNLLQTSKEAFTGEIFPFELQLNQSLEVEFPEKTGQLVPYIAQSQNFVCNDTACILVRFFQSTLSKSHSKVYPSPPTKALSTILKELNISAIITDENGRIADSTSAGQTLLSATEETLRGRSAIQILEDARSPNITDDLPVSQKLIHAQNQKNTIPSQIILELELEDDQTLELKCIALNGSFTPSLANQLIIFNRPDASKQETKDKSYDNKDLELMAAGIAHDFKNLVSAIISHISIARLKIKHTAVSEKLDAAEAAAWQAKTLSQRLMHLADPRKPEVNQHGNYSLTGLVRSCVQMHLKNSTISYELILDEPLWDCTVEYTQMTQVINNLLINAQQAMPDGGHIEIKANNSENINSKGTSMAKKPQDFICLRIRDTGPGIGPSKLTKIFEPYYTTKAKGHGIGLANCKSIINAHGGQISVESKIGQGSTFLIQIPRICQPANAKQVNPKTPQATKYDKGSQRGIDHKTKGRILVMDDMEAMRDVAGDILNLLGYECVFTEDGQAAIDAYKENKLQGRSFDAVLFDLTVPGAMGGEEAANKIKEMDPQLKAIACSGYADSNIMQNFKNSPFTAVVPKPYRIQEMRDTLNHVLEYA